MQLGQSDFSTLRKILLAIALPAASCCVHAQDAKGQAVQAAVADGVSSAAMLMTGAVAINPLLPLMSVGMKAATLEYTSRLPEHEKPAAYGAATAMWSGTAVNNVCMTASILSGGSFLPACVALGVAWGVRTWKEGERDRLSGGCAVLREFMYEPEAACNARPVVAEATRTAITAQELTAP
jgi:hypothetical protein